MPKFDYDPESLLQGLAEAVKDRRRELAITQEDLSYDAGFSRGYLSDIERSSRSLSLKSLSKLANALQVSPSYLLRKAENNIGAPVDEIQNTDIANNPLIDKVALCELGEIFELLCSNAVSIMLTDPNSPNNPIVFATYGVETLTGYSRSEIVGRNCRFLQNDDRNQFGQAKLRQAVQDQTACCVVIRNYRKDGSLFFNNVIVRPVFLGGKKAVNFLGIQRQFSSSTDVSP